MDILESRRYLSAPEGIVQFISIDDPCATVEENADDFEACIAHTIEINQQIAAAAESGDYPPDLLYAVDEFLQWYYVGENS